MPLYEYECFLCRKRFERLQSFAADPVKECPECGGAVRRLLGVPALQFKGSGFYLTDYGKGNGDGSKRDTAEKQEKQEKQEKKETKETTSESATPAPKKEKSDKSSSAEKPS